MINQLQNPKTELYLDFKKLVFSPAFPWFYHEKSTDLGCDDDDFVNLPFYSHGFLTRPESTESKFSTVNSQYVDVVSKIFLEIFKYNNLKINYFIRLNANCVHPQETVLNTVPHTDHPFEHKNCLIYLTNSGGPTVIGNSKDNTQMYEGKEDDVITFGGDIHFHKTPEKHRRLVLVATFN